VEGGRELRQATVEQSRTRLGTEVIGEWEGGGKGYLLHRPGLHAHRGAEHGGGPAGHLGRPRHKLRLTDYRLPPLHGVGGDWLLAAQLLGHRLLLLGVRLQGSRLLNSTASQMPSNITKLSNRRMSMPTSRDVITSHTPPPLQDPQK